MEDQFTEKNDTFCYCQKIAVEKVVLDKNKNTYGSHYMGCQDWPTGCSYFRWILDKSNKKQKEKRGESTEQNVKKRKIDFETPITKKEKK